MKIRIMLFSIFCLLSTMGFAYADVDKTTKQADTTMPGEIDKYAGTNEALIENKNDVAGLVEESKDYIPDEIIKLETPVDAKGRSYRLTNSLGADGKMSIDIVQKDADGNFFKTTYTLDKQSGSIYQDVYKNGELVSHEGRKPSQEGYGNLLTLMKSYAGNALIACATSDRESVRKANLFISLLSLYQPS